MAVKKKKETAPPPPAYPKIFETFKEIGTWESIGWVDSEPSAFNGWVRVERYRITVEKIEEPIEVIHQRLEQLWLECDNWHHWEPLLNKARQFNYSFKGERGSQKKPK